MDALLDFEECLQDSPAFRLAVDQFESDVAVLELQINKVLKCCSTMVEAGQVYSSANQLFVSSVSEITGLQEKDSTMGKCLSQLDQGLQEVLTFHTILLDQTQRAINQQLTSLLTQFFPPLGEIRREFVRVRDHLDTAALKNAQVSRHKASDVEQASHLLIATRKCYQHFALDYCLQLNNFKVQQKLAQLSAESTVKRKHLEHQHLVVQQRMSEIQTLPPRDGELLTDSWSLLVEELVTDEDTERPAVKVEDCALFTNPQGHEHNEDLMETPPQVIYQVKPEDHSLILIPITSAQTGTDCSVSSTTSEHQALDELVPSSVAMETKNNPTKSWASRQRPNTSQTDLHSEDEDVFDSSASEESHSCRPSEMSRHRHHVAQLVDTSGSSEGCKDRPARLQRLHKHSTCKRTDAARRLHPVNVKRCAYCQGLFRQHIFHRHLKSCEFSPQSATIEPDVQEVRSPPPRPPGNQLDAALQEKEEKKRRRRRMSVLEEEEEDIVQDDVPRETMRIKLERTTDGPEQSYYSSPHSGEECVLPSGESPASSTSHVRPLQCRDATPNVNADMSSSPCKCKGEGPLSPCQSSDPLPRQRSNHNPAHGCSDGTTLGHMGKGGSASVLVPAGLRKCNGSRMYSKRHYCLYCASPFHKIARHLERVHLKETEVSRALSFPKGSSERRLQLECLRNKGNFEHNVKVLQIGSGVLIPRKQPNKQQEGKDFIHCIHCQALFTRSVLWRHVLCCKFKASGAKSKPGRTRVQSLRAFGQPSPSGVGVDLWKLVTGMMQDNIFCEVTTDSCIMDLGKHLYNKLGADVNRHEYIRQKLRQLGRLRLRGREVTQLKYIKDYVKPTNFMHAVTAIKHTAGYDNETGKYKVMTLPLKLGASLKKVSMLLESEALMKSDKDSAEDARCFRQLYDARWHELVSSDAHLQALAESKWNPPQLLAFTEDLKTLHSHLEQKQHQCCSDLALECSSVNWANLAKVTLTQVLLFNRRREEEVSKMPLSTYVLREPSEPEEEVALSKLEKVFCHHLVRLEIKRKGRGKVPVLLTPAMVKSLDLLVDKRGSCGVLDDNTYMFARPSAVSHYRGSECIRYFVNACGIKNPRSLTSTKLRKHVATLSKVLSLKETQLDQLADFLGHDIREPLRFHGLPEGTLQLARITKLLMALEQGCVAEFKGKTLGDISITPNEEVQCAEEVQGGNLSGRKPYKRKTWVKAEVDAIQKHLMRFIESRRLPGKAECVRCLQSEPEALKRRDWLAIKFYIKNRIAALKIKK